MSWRRHGMALWGWAACIALCGCTVVLAAAGGGSGVDVWGRDLGFFERRRQELVSRAQGRVLQTTVTGSAEGQGFVGRIRRANDSAELTCRRVQRASPVDALRRLQKARGEAVEQKPSKSMTPSRALSRIPKLCLELNAGWWSYQWCHRYEARQYHRDADSGRVETLHSLGTYSATGDTVHGGDPPPSAPNAPPFYIEQEFQGGSPCSTEAGSDVPRRTVARFFCCDTGTAHPVSVVRVREEEACAYAFDMCSPLACDALPQPVQEELQRQRESRTPLGSVDVEGMDGPRALGVAQRLLQPLRGTCVVRHEGWWSYELCLGRRAQQFHVERPSGNGATGEDGTVTARFLLGKASDSSSDTGSGGGGPGSGVSGVSENRTPRLGVTAAGYPFVSQWFGDGTPCDISATPRRTHVLMFCNERAPASGRGDEPLELGPDEAVQRLRAMRQQSGPADAPPPPQPMAQRYADEDEAEELEALRFGRSLSRGQSHKTRMRLIAIAETSTCEYRAFVAVPELCAHPLLAPIPVTLDELQCTAPPPSGDEV